MEIKHYFDQLIASGYFDDNRVYFRTENADLFFSEALDGLNMDMLPEYQEVIDWMKDNQGYGLYMLGNNGRGKSLIASKVLPIFFDYYLKKVVTCYPSITINEKADEIKSKKIVILDDIGIEDQKSDYGERKWIFPEIMDNAEVRGNLVIFTTNLKPESIQDKYGIRTRERIRACCRPVVFKGESLRK